MTRPTHHKYHIGEHNPLAEGGNIGVVRRERPLNISGAEAKGSSVPTPRPVTAAAATKPGAIAKDYLAQSSELVSRYPVLSFLAACGLGFVVTRAGSRAGRRLSR